MLKTLRSSNLTKRALASYLIRPTPCIIFSIRRMASFLPKLPIFEAIASHDPTSTAVIHSVSGRRFTYGELLHDVVGSRDRLFREARPCDLNGQRIAFLIENSYDYVVTLLAILGTNSVAVPMSPAFPVHELQYIMNQSQAFMLLSSRKFETKSREVLGLGLESSSKLVLLEKKQGGGKYDRVPLKNPSSNQGGMILYTSGTTSRPKGVLLVESVMTAQSKSLLQAWKYSRDDHLLHVLPLHHIHGIINALVTPLFAGSAIEFLFPFNAQAVWKRMAAPFLPETDTTSRVTLWTAVPTIYNRLLETHKDLSENVQSASREAISPENLRLNISGSAALPTPTKKAWTELSKGNVLLERYGMTEVGMALSCGLEFVDRVDGSVGWPLPYVQVRLVDTESNEVIQPGQELTKDGKERDGEIQLRGPTVFTEYFRNEAATEAEFVDSDDGQDRWFKTGDIARRREVPEAGHSNQEWARGPMYFIRGRKSADIIKIGGEKVSALEVERELLSLPQISEAAVMAVPSGNWGQKVGAAIILKPNVLGKDGKSWGPLDVRRALKDRLAAYKIPQIFRFVNDIPKNAMGKINKRQLVKELFIEETSGDET